MVEQITKISDEELEIEISLPAPAPEKHIITKTQLLADKKKIEDLLKKF